MSLATNLEDRASKLLSKFDERISGIDSIQLEQIPIGFNPITGEDEPGTPVISDLIGVVVNFTKKHTNAVSGNGNTIQTGDQLLKVSSTVEPTMGDKILLDGLKYSIVDISPVRYTNVTLLYTVHIRR